ncbi:3H domain-containing protein [Peptoniphilus asaccharolyticus]
MKKVKRRKRCCNFGALLCGVIKVDLNIKYRRDIFKFMQQLESGVSIPLKGITSNYHYHIKMADSEEILFEVEEKLKEKGFILENDEEFNK